ncbi:hypothetical protein CBP27_17260, partial [Fischerella thermalis WC542]
MYFGVKSLLGFLILGFIVASSVFVSAQQPYPYLRVVYPPPNHQTSADRIFFLGTAPASGQVLINGKAIRRSQSGHFAPSLPLQVGENTFKI